MTFRRSIVALLCFPLLGADANKSSDESATQTVVKSSPLDLLQGSWEVVSFEPGGEKALGRVFIFRGNELLWRNPDTKQPHVTFQLKLGQAGELPTLDLSRDLDGRQITALGVYRLEGDTLELHYGWGNERPASLERPSGGFTFTLKRLK